MGSEYDDPGCASRLVIDWHVDCVCCFSRLETENPVFMLVA